MFQLEVFWIYIRGKIGESYKQFMCSHDKAVVVKNSDTEKITVCSNCGKRIVRNKSFWRKLGEHNVKLYCRRKV